MTIEHKTHPVQFIIRPNCSLSWKGNKLFFASMVAVSLGIAGSFAALGYWLILPFAGLELLVLAGALYACGRKAEWREIVSVTGDRVAVSAGRRRPEKIHTFDRHWVVVALVDPVAGGYPSKLLIRGHGREIELGRCLQDEDRERLAMALRRVLAC